MVMLSSCTKTEDPEFYGVLVEKNQLDTGSRKTTKDTTKTKTDSTKTNPTTPTDTKISEDANWIRIEKKSYREANATYGNFDDTLTIATKWSIFQTLDKGKTWIVRKQLDQTTYGFLAVKDSLFLLESYLKDTKTGQKTATFSQHFSTDNGYSWKNAGQFGVSTRRQQDFATVHPDHATTIRLKENIKRRKGEELILKTDIEVIKNGSSKILSLPFDNQITNLHLDKKGRLYVSASCALHVQSTGEFLYYEAGKPAIVYISKRPILDMIN